MSYSIMMLKLKNVPWEVRKDSHCGVDTEPALLGILVLNHLFFAYSPARACTASPAGPSSVRNAGHSAGMLVFSRIESIGQMDKY